MAELAVATGERPFGAVIVGADGTIISEAHGHSIAQKDLTSHAEVTAIRNLHGRYDRAFLAGCTLYSSAEPCAMCAGAIYWANIQRVVFGLSEERLRMLRDVSEHTSALQMKCEAVLATGGHPTVVIGSVLEDEAIVPHLGFWATAV